MPSDERFIVNSKKADCMRKIVSLCAIFSGSIVSATAGEQGLASYYYNSHYAGLTAAHRSLPIGSQVKVVNLDNGLSATVKIVERGPFIRGRIIDVSIAAAGALGFRQAGTAHVRLEKL